MNLHLKRVYETPQKSDGQRILVERLWPRGLTKEKAQVDVWLKEIAPTTELRKWFNHEPEKWPEFQKRYRRELAANDEAVAQLKAEMKKGVVTLVYAARDEEHNAALVLCEFVRSQPTPNVTKPETFSVGDHVRWNSEAGHVSGKIIKVHHCDFDYKGHTHHASADDPQYEIKSDKTDHIAAHKGSALERIGDG